MIYGGRALAMATWLFAALYFDLDLRNLLGLAIVLMGGFALGELLIAWSAGRASTRTTLGLSIFALSFVVLGFLSLARGADRAAGFEELVVLLIGLIGVGYARRTKLAESAEAVG